LPPELSLVFHQVGQNIDQQFDTGQSAEEDDCEERGKDQLVKAIDRTDDQ
jgi:hypothetical protein